MKVNVSCSSVQTTIDILEENQGEDESILTLGQLRDRIATDNDVDVETMKLLHRGCF